MSAVCKCINGHIWNARIIEDDPTTNCITLDDKDTICPDCGNEEFEIIDEDDDFNDIREM